MLSRKTIVCEWRSRFAIHWFVCRLPYRVEGSDGAFPLPLHGLPSDEELGKMVGQLTWFSHQSLVLEVFPGDLLIDILQAHEKCAVAKSDTKHGETKENRMHETFNNCFQTIQLSEPGY